MELPVKLRKALMQEAHGAIGDILLGDNLDVNTTFEVGTLLLHAAAYGRNDVIIELMKSGADWDLRNQSQQCALHIAAERGRGEVVATLLDNGAAVDPIDSMRCTPLLLAVKERHIEVVHKLIEHGADVNVCDKNGWTPLYYSLQYGSLVMTERLMKAGAHITNRAQGYIQNRHDEMKSMVKYFEDKPTWLRPYIAGKDLTYMHIMNCEERLVHIEGFASEEVFASVSPAQFNGAYLTSQGIYGLGLHQMLLDLHCRLREKHSGGDAAGEDYEVLGKRKST